MEKEQELELPYEEIVKSAARSAYRENKDIKATTQLFKVPYDIIQVRKPLEGAEHGFNWRSESNPGFSWESLNELADSILQNGLIEPIRGDLSTDGKIFWLTEGERRWRAITILRQRPGVIYDMVEVVPNLVSVSELDRCFIMLASDNKVKYTAMEIATGIAFIKKTFNKSNDEIAKRAGKSRQWVDGMLKIAGADDDTKQEIIEGKRTASSVINAPARKTKTGDEMSGIIGKSKIPTSKDRTIGEGSGSDMMNDVQVEKEKTEQEKILLNITKNLGKIESLFGGLANDQAKTDGDNFLKWLRTDVDALNLFFAKRENRDVSKHVTVESVNVLVKLVDTNRVSDGYHTFGQLYDHRIALYITLCQHFSSFGIDVWRSRVHSDGTNFEGWFVLGIGTEQGKQITYHLPEKEWDNCNFAVIYPKAPEFDGHTSEDVLERIRTLRVDLKDSYSERVAQARYNALNNNDHA